MENFRIRKEARRLAEELLTQARENELKITADLQKIASEVDAKIISLENRFKTEESLVRDSAKQNLELLGKRGNDKRHGLQRHQHHGNFFTKTTI